jgi:hypothetical protein
MVSDFAIGGGHFSIDPSENRDFSATLFSRHRSGGHILKPRTPHSQSHCHILNRMPSSYHQSYHRIAHILQIDGCRECQHRIRDFLQLCGRHFLLAFCIVYSFGYGQH